jgi:hypothetical protein
MNHHFVVMWNNTGLEYVGDITADEINRSWRALKGQSSGTALPNLNHMILRARYNPQRHYEIYQIEATDGITSDDIRDMFQASPQTAADTIRRLGHCLHSDREQENQVVIR